jgi:serine/threonine protein kinase
VNSEETIFEHALGISSPLAREAYLRDACVGDAALLERLQGLLGALDRAGRFLEHAQPAAGAPGLDLGAVPSPPGGTIILPLTEKAGDRIGRYKLLEKIGEGGCGVVYMAQQEEPVRRRVALKIIKLGMDTRQVIARFEAERQALALMDHPNIARVHDAGATATGRPYFVMELVRGMKLTDYCDEKTLSTQARLELFIQVCRAVQHAHQKGIIHRDLKPSNILVTVNDGVAVPKIIDFGIAKATNDQRLTDKTVFTAFEQFIGTPAYMSPEQAEITSVDIDTRADIYSLGVLLYELLIGRTPFDTNALLRAGLDEMRRTIREQEPERPSTRVSTLGAEELTTTAKRRGLEPPKLISQLRGDLDWIVMKCLEKDRGRRYETANGLARDIQRHLNHEPVAASPPDLLYVTGKLLRRRRREVTAAVLLLALLLLALTAVLQGRRAGAVGQALKLASLRLEESEALNQVIAKVPLSKAEQDRVRACVSRLAGRVRAGSGTEVDHERLARFMTRGVRLGGRSIQRLDGPIGFSFSYDRDYPVDGVGIIVQPFVTVEGTPVEVGSYPVYMSGNSGNVGVGGGLHFDRVVTTPGVWRFSCVVEAQLVHAKEKGLGSTGARVADFHTIGAPVRIALPAVDRTFLRQLPENYPLEVVNEPEVKQIAEGLAVTGGRLVIEKPDKCTCEFKLVVPSPERSLPLVLRVDLVQLGNRPLQGSLNSLIMHDGVASTGDGDRVKGLLIGIRPKGLTVEYDFKFILPGIQAQHLQERPASIEISFRSSREVALGIEEIEHFLSFPEVRKVFPINVEDARSK